MSLGRPLTALVAVSYVSMSVGAAVLVGSYEQLSEPARVLGPWAVGGLTVYGVPHVKRWMGGDL